MIFLMKSKSHRILQSLSMSLQTDRVFMWNTSPIKETKFVPLQMNYILVSNHSLSKMAWISIIKSFFQWCVILLEPYSNNIFGRIFSKFNRFYISTSKYSSSVPLIWGHQKGICSNRHFGSYGLIFVIVIILPTMENNSWRIGRLHVQALAP